MNRAGLRFWDALPATVLNTDYDAMAEFFAITLDDSIEIFGPNSYVSKFETTAAMVANRMQAMLDAHLQAQPVDRSEPVVVMVRELELA